jgi:hypothetical protein
MPIESEQPENLRASVIDRFRRVAIAPDQERKFPIGPESAKKLGYAPAEVDALPTSVTDSFCGVGNPFSLGQPLPGETVLDLGCGVSVHRCSCRFCSGLFARGNIRQWTSIGVSG